MDSIVSSVLTFLSGSFFLGVLAWLSKFWADYSLEKQKSELALLKDKLLKQHNQKVETYRQAIDVIAHILSELDHAMLGVSSAEEQQIAFKDFNKNRLRVYGYLAMIAPQEVMDAQDKLMDAILLVIHQKKQHNWVELRGLAIDLLNLIRKDIDVDSGSIQYNGGL